MAESFPNKIRYIIEFFWCFYVYFTHLSHQIQSKNVYLFAQGTASTNAKGVVEINDRIPSAAALLARTNRPRLITKSKSQKRHKLICIYIQKFLKKIRHNREQAGAKMNYNITEIKASHSREKDLDIYSVEYEIERMLSIALAISTYFELVCTEKSILLALEVHRTSHAVAS